MSSVVSLHGSWTQGASVASLGVAQRFKCCSAFPYLLCVLDSHTGALRCGRRRYISRSMLHGHGGALDLEIRGHGAGAAEEMRAAPPLRPPTSPARRPGGSFGHRHPCDRRLHAGHLGGPDSPCVEQGHPFNLRIKLSGEESFSLDDIAEDEGAKRPRDTIDEACSLCPISPPGRRHRRTRSFAGAAGGGMYDIRIARRDGAKLLCFDPCHSDENCMTSVEDMKIHTEEIFATDLPTGKAPERFFVEMPGALPTQGTMNLQHKLMDVLVFILDAPDERITWDAMSVQEARTTPTSWSCATSVASNTLSSSARRRLEFQSVAIALRNRWSKVRSSHGPVLALHLNQDPDRLTCWPVTCRFSRATFPPRSAAPSTRSSKRPTLGATDYRARDGTQYWQAWRRDGRTEKHGCMTAGG